MKLTHVAAIVPRSSSLTALLISALWRSTGTFRTLERSEYNFNTFYGDCIDKLDRFSQGIIIFLHLLNVLAFTDQLP